VVSTRPPPIAACRLSLSSGCTRPKPEVRGHEIIATEQPFAACGKLSAMLDARLKRKECKKCYWIHATRLFDVSDT
jgi:hypothetical protein